MTNAGCSIIMITYNEEELLPYTLKHLLSFEYFNELCILDSFSTDKTEEIVKEFIPIYKSKGKDLKFEKSIFKNFGDQCNKVMAMASYDLFFLTAVDELYTRPLKQLLYDLQFKPELENYNCVRMPTIFMIDDINHFINHCGPDPHVKIWRRRLNINWAREVHELMMDDKGRNMHDYQGPEVINVWNHQEYKDIAMKHCQLLKSDSCLKDKGTRWKEFGMIEKSAQNGIHISEDFWLNAKNSIGKEIVELPEVLKDDIYEL